MTEPNADVLEALSSPEVARAIQAGALEALQPLLEQHGKAVAGLAELVDSMRRRDPIEEKTPKGYEAARAIRYIALGKGDVERGIREARRHWGKAEVDSCHVAKALQAGDADAAGNLIAPQWAREMIELLRNMEVFSRIPGVRRPPMPGGSLTFRKQGTAGTASYVGEGDNIPTSQQTVNLLTLTARKLVALTPVSNDLLRQAGPDADAFVRDDLLQVMALKRDVTFLTGTGLSDTPAGLDTLVASANQDAQAGTTLANIQSDYTSRIRKVEAANIPVSAEPANAAWVMSAQVKWALFRQATTTGAHIFRDEIRAGRFYGYPIVTSEQGGNAKVYFVHGPSCLIGETLRLRIEAFDGAAYHDGSSVVSGVSKDETVIRAIDEHDFQLRHDLGASILTSVTLS